MQKCMVSMTGKRESSATEYHAPLPLVVCCTGKHSPRTFQYLLLPMNGVCLS